MNFFKNLFKPNLEKLKLKQDTKSLIEALKKYANEYDDGFVQNISDTIVEIGSFDTLNEMETILKNDEELFRRTYKSVLSSAASNIIFKTARKLRQKISSTATPVVMKDEELEEKWRVVLKDIKYHDKSVLIEELKEKYERGLVQGIKCQRCFHLSVIGLNEKVYIHDWDPDVILTLESICLYCGHIHHGRSSCCEGYGFAK